MKLSDKFYKMLNDIDNFSELPDDDPKVIEIRKQAAFDLHIEYVGVRKTENKPHNHTAGSVYDDTTLDNLTPTRYIYMIQHGVQKSKLLKKLDRRTQFIDPWLKEHELVKSDQQYYELTYKGKVIDKEFLVVNDIAKYLGLVVYRNNTLSLPNGYTSRIVNRYEPTLEEALEHDKEDAFSYWHSHRVFAKPKPRTRKAVLV